MQRQLGFMYVYYTYAMIVNMSFLMSTCQPQHRKTPREELFPTLAGRARTGQAQPPSDIGMHVYEPFPEEQDPERLKSAAQRGCG